MWGSPRDWPRILPQLTPPSVVDVAKLETFSADWRYALSDDRGRLYVAIRHAKTPAEEEVLQLALTARGAIEGDTTAALREGFEAGHDSIVRSFSKMTSAEAQRLWKR